MLTAALSDHGTVTAQQAFGAELGTFGASLAASLADHSAVFAESAGFTEFRALGAGAALGADLGAL